MKSLKLVITILTISVILSSCALSKSKKDSQAVITPENIYHGAMAVGGNPQASVSGSSVGADWSDLPYVPVISPPEVLRVWIYDHVTPSNDLVVGHWVFIKIKPERWYIEDIQGEPSRSNIKFIPKPPSDMPAIPAQIPQTGK